MRPNRISAILVTLFVAHVCAFAAELPKPLTDADFRTYPEARAKLGQLLFYDRILSGTYRVSCATCHNHDRASSNGVRLDGRKEKRDELAVNNEPVYEPFKPSAAHAPALFNLGAKEFTKLFSDGRVARLPDGSFRSPVGKDLPKGLDDVLAVQALFPAVQSDELIGTVDNDIAAVAHKGNAAIWDALAARIRGLPEYWPYFEAAFPKLEKADDITIVEIGNAIGAFVGTEWRSDDTPFDQHLRGNNEALTDLQKRGMQAFYGEAGCSACHAGALQSDHQLHSVSKERRRTPSLRNINATAPYGGNGSVGSLPDYLAMHTPDLEEDMRSDILAFLEALTDENGLRGKLGKPADVPSSLALD